MLYKSLLSALLVASSAVQVSAHAAISPALGIAGTPVRKDAQKPTAANPCGKEALTAIDTSKSVAADASGSFTVPITNFNAGKDGSREVTLKVDASGTGKNFVAGTVSKNGEKAPTAVGTEQITASLPAGTKCTGGKAGNLCLAAFTTAGGFGNCVVVSQGGGAAGGANSTASADGKGGAAGGKGGATGGATTTGAANNTAAAGGKGGANAADKPKKAAGKTARAFLFSA